jgi:hypothetical protein
MFDLSVIATGGLWVLADDREGRLAEFPSQAEALEAAAQYARLDDNPRLVLIQGEAGEWFETVVEPTAYH